MSGGSFLKAMGSFIGDCLGAVLKATSNATNDMAERKEFYEDLSDQQLLDRISRGEMRDRMAVMLILKERGYDTEDIKNAQ